MYLGNRSTHPGITLGSLVIHRDTRATKKPSVHFSAQLEEIKCNQYRSVHRKIRKKNLNLFSPSFFILTTIIEFMRARLLIVFLRHWSEIIVCQLNSLLHIFFLFPLFFRTLLEDGNDVRKSEELQLKLWNHHDFFGHSKLQTRLYFPSLPLNLPSWRQTNRDKKDKQSDGSSFSLSWSTGTRQRWTETMHYSLYTNFSEEKVKT